MPLMKLREPHAGNVLLTIGITNCVCCGKLLDNAHKKKTPTKGNLYFLYVFLYFVFLLVFLYFCIFVFCIFYLYLCFYFVFCIFYLYLCFYFVFCILYFLFIIYSSTSSIFKSVSFTVNSRGFK